MFEQITLADGAGRTKPWSFAASMTVQAILLGAALTLPMLQVARIEARIPVNLILPRALEFPEPVRQTHASRSSVSSVFPGAERNYKPFHAPAHIPTSVATGPDLPGAPVYAIVDGGSGSYGSSTGIPGVTELPGHSFVVTPPEPKREPAPAATAPASIRVGEGVQAAKLVFGPKPAYPGLAKQARISGTVRLAAQISADGHIRDLRVVSGHPMLIAAAIDAVRRWVYRPTLLNQEAVEVFTEIEVNFVLQ